MSSGEFVAVTLSATFNYDLETLKGIGIDPDDPESMKETALEDLAQSKDAFEVTINRNGELVEPQKDDAPTAICGCGFQLIWIDEHWEHDAAPSLWGNDHDPDAEPPKGYDPVDEQKHRYYEEN